MYWPCVISKLWRTVSRDVVIFFFVILLFKQFPLGILSGDCFLKIWSHFKIFILLWVWFAILQYLKKIECYDGSKFWHPAWHLGEFLKTTYDKLTVTAAASFLPQKCDSFWHWWLKKWPQNFRTRIDCNHEILSPPNSWGLILDFFTLFCLSCLLPAFANLWFLSEVIKAGYVVRVITRSMEDNSS